MKSNGQSGAGFDISDLDSVAREGALENDDNWHGKESKEKTDVNKELQDQCPLVRNSSDIER